MDRSVGFETQHPELLHHGLDGTSSGEVRQVGLESLVALLGDAERRDVWGRAGAAHARLKRRGIAHIVRDPTLRETVRIFEDNPFCLAKRSIETVSGRQDVPSDG